MVEGSGRDWCFILYCPRRRFHFIDFAICLANRKKLGNGENGQRVLSSGGGGWDCRREMSTLEKQNGDGSGGGMGKSWLPLSLIL